MKTLKRMLAVMLAVVMMMGLGVTSMAATPSADGEITVPVKVEVVGLPVKLYWNGNSWGVI